MPQDPIQGTTPGRYMSQTPFSKILYLPQGELISRLIILPLRQVNNFNVPSWQAGFVLPEEHCSEFFFAGLLLVFELLVSCQYIWAPGK